MSTKLLLVDDNKQSLKLINAIFSIEGYETITAYDGAQAIEILKKEPVDLVISDILMPNVDGYYLCFKIRTNPLLKNIPVIIYTATYTSKSEERLAMEMGADLFIRKPAPSQVLLDSVAKVLGNPQQQREPVARTEASFESMHRYSSDLITKLEQRNIELEKTTQNLERVLTQFKHAELIAGMGHWEVDAATQNVTGSDAIYRLYGFEPGSVRISAKWFLSKTHPDDRQKIKNVISDVARKLKSLSFGHRVVMPDETVRHFYTVIRLDFDNQGKPKKLYGTSIDTTLITENEQKLLASNRELETFVYKAYHDLKSPSSSIAGLVNLSSTENDPATIKKYVTLIGEMAEKQIRMLKTLNRTMLVRNLVPVDSEVDMALLINKTISDIETHGPPKVKIKILNELTSTIITDGDVIGDILYQVVLNAIQFADPKKPDKIVTIKTFGKNDMLEIEVADNGIGIEESVKSKIFDLYYRGSDMSKGAGLGLYLVKNAVEKLNGTISVNSDIGKGTSVVISIPISR
jgi:signal transduction histidine kinase/DNA-binding response OmpR family regulator